MSRLLSQEALTSPVPGVELQSTGRLSPDVKGRTRVPGRGSGMCKGTGMLGDVAGEATQGQRCTRRGRD